MSDALTHRVLVIGWDAADWKHINPLLKKGWMPTLARLMQEGVWGNIATLHPILSPMLWTSIATGKRPYKHGIHGFVEPMPDDKGVRPSASTTRTTKAIWNILTQVGLKTHVIGWFCGHPAEPINGVCVSEMYAKAIDQRSQATADDWPLPEGAVHPHALSEELAGLRLHPAELTAQDILPFIPHAAQIDQDKDRRLAIFAKLLAEMASTHAAATYALEHHPWDFAGIYYDAVDHFCHAFMRYHAPRMQGVSETDFEIYKDVITGCYRFHDMMLARLLDLAGPETTVIICSDHGFHCDHLRPVVTPREPAGPAIWHREHGILCLSGPGIKRGDHLFGATLLDVAPTVMTLLGEPIGLDMDGKPLVQAFDRPVVARHIPSWDEVNGEAGMHSSERRQDPFEAREAIRQLVELGYIEQPDENDSKAAENAAREARYNLARAYLDGGIIEQATTLLEKLIADEPDALRFRAQLARCYLADQRYDDARRLGEDLLQRAEHLTVQRAEAAERQAQYLREHQDEIIENTAEQVRSSKIGPQDNPPLQIPTVESLEQTRSRLHERAERLRNVDVRVTPAACLLLGTLELAAGHLDEALTHMQRAERAEPRLPGLHNHLGHTYLRLRRHEDAARAFTTALEIDGDSAVAHEGLAAALVRMDCREEAVEHALTAVELMHHMPRAHLRLGITLAMLGLNEQAVEAFETCLKLAPMTALAHRWLARLYRLRLGRPDLVAEHLLKANQIRRMRPHRASA